MRRYRVAPIRSRADDWPDDIANPNTTIDVSIPEHPWEQLPLIDPNTGRFIEVYTGPERPGFIWTQEDD
jgi:hypothetical protein